MADYIPPELISNILARLLVRNLLRFTSVCKSWYSLITSSSFISLHLNSSNANNEARMLLRYGHNHYYVHHDNPSFDEIAKLDPPIPLCKYCTVIGSFNGLYCLNNFHEETTIVLWNPSIRKSLILPRPGDLSGFIMHLIGFGFLPETNQYKIVRVAHHIPLSKPKVDIYDLSVGLWRNIDAGDFPFVIESGILQAFLNGTVHWLYNNVFKFPSRSIMTFDMKTEKFGSLMLPNSLSIVSRHFDLYTYKESLHLNCIQDGNCIIWAMKEYGVEGSWEKICSIDLRQHHFTNPIYVRESGDIFFLQLLPRSCRVVSYDPKTKKVNNVGIFAHSVRINSYVESLVLINHSNGDKRVLVYL